MGFLQNLLGQGESEGEWSEQDMTPDEKKLAGYIKNKVEEVRSTGARISSEGIWMTNIAYLLGYDSVYYDKKANMYRPINNARNLKRNRVHVNKILPTAQNRLARLCKNPPKFDIRPESGTQEDKDKARENLEILRQLWDQAGVQLNKKRIPLIQWTQQCGHAFIKVSWDENEGQPMKDPMTGEFLGYEGDIRADICSAFEVFVDPLAKSIEDAQWVVQAKVRKLDYFCTHYPERGGAVKEEGAWLLSVQYEQRINSLNKAQSGGTGSNEQMKNAAIELSYYEKRSRKHPNGRHVVVANGVLLKDDELTIGEIPFTKFDDIIIAGKFYSEAVITHLRPLQDQFNRNLTLRSAWVNRMLRGKYIAAKGHGISQESINDDDTEVVQYDPVPGAPEPRAMDIPTIPQYTYKEEESLDLSFDKISGIGEVSQGQMPSASIPAIGMQILQEQDETRIGIMTEWSEDGFARVGKQLLMFARAMYKTPRKRKMAGKNGEYNIKDFIGDDIGETIDVTVIRGSTNPTSKVLRRQELLNLYQQGLLGDPNDSKVRDSLLQKLEYGDIGEVWLDQSLDMAQIKKTLEEIEQGIPPEVSEFDNHELHCQEKNRYRKSDKFESLGPERQALLIADIEMHLEYIVQISTPPGAITAPSPEEAVATDNAMAEQAEDGMNAMNLADGPIEQVPEA